MNIYIFYKILYELMIPFQIDPREHTITLLYLCIFGKFAAM